jgi:hypothetical protein
LAKSNCLDGAALRSTVFAKSFIFKRKQTVHDQQLTKNKIRSTTACLVKMIKRPKQLEST